MYGATLLLGATGIGLLISFLCWVPPLIIRNGEGTRDPFVRKHATESVNFQLSVLIVSIPLLFIELLFIVATGGFGALLVLPFALALLAFCVWQNIVGSIAANKGEPFRYLLNFRLLNT